MFDDYPWMKWVLILLVVVVVGYLALHIAKGVGGGAPDPILQGYVTSLRNPLVSATEYRGGREFTIDADPLAEQTQNGNDTREALAAKATDLAQRIANDCKSQTGKDVTVSVRILGNRIVSVNSQ